MSITASSLLARLEELKKWQEEQQERLSQQQLPRLERSNVSTSYDTIEGLSEFNLSEEGVANSIPIPRTVLNDKNTNVGVSKASPKLSSCIRKNQVPVRNIEEITVTKPKKPFLKRGTGLVRFKMNPGDQKRPFNKVVQRTSNRRENQDNNNKNTLNKQNVECEVTPLKRPEVNIKAVWFRVQDDNEELIQESKAEVPEEVAKKTILQINELAAQNMKFSERKSLEPNERMFNTLGVAPIKDNSEQNRTKPVQQIHSDQSLYEQQLERELLIFEALEEKAMNSSFCSTNSSVLHILSSTPSKIRNRSVTKNPPQEIHERRFSVPDDILEEIEEDKNSPLKLPESAERGRTLCEDELDRIDSLESSVTSEDFQEIPNERTEFKDDVPWSDVNIYTRENSSLSSASYKSNKSCGHEDTLVSKRDHVETGVNTDFDETNEILAKKLKELDDEIRNFRKENAKLQRAKLDLEKEQREFKKEKKAFEKYVLEEKINVEFYLEDEKKKLAKEKMVFERYVKDVHNKTSRKEREEISALKEELANLKEAAKLKETRNATSQARLRNQLKSFEKEVSNLREELEKLRKQNAKLLTTQQFTKKSTDTKMLHEINKNLSKLTKDAKVSEQLKKAETSIEKKKDLLNALEVQDDGKKKSDSDESNDYFYGQRRCDDRTNIDQRDHSTNGDSYKNYQAYLNSGNRTLAEDGTAMEHAVDNEDDDLLHSSSGYKTEVSLEKDYELMFGRNNVRTIQDNKVTEDNTVVAVNKEISSDGVTTLKYPNGNVKTISADGNYITLRYYNGDIKETKLLEGVIRYYYAENGSWQTTMADGTEILEFPDGQIEKKHKDGTTEIKFPNGILKVTKAGGVQTISYPDKTVVEVNENGEKVISLPNGQKEIHSFEHMRREYPDGTVKMLYPDGVQETRYSNGRIRIKDKHGNLVLDSHADNT